MNPEEAKRFGTYLAEVRVRKKLSQRELGHIVGVPNSTILRLERGENRAPRLDLLTAIADALSVPLADMFGMVGYAVPSELPSVGPYLRAKYREFPPEMVDEIEAHVQRVAKRLGVELSGPPLEDDCTEAREPRRKKRREGAAQGGRRSR